MREHARRWWPASRRSRPHEQPAGGSPGGTPPRRHHPLLFAVGALIVLLVVGGAALAVWSLYSDATWRSSARETAEAVAAAVQSQSARTGVPPKPIDVVAGVPGEGQTALEELPYATQLPDTVARFRISDAGALSVLTTADALCAGVTVSLTQAGNAPTGAFGCGDPLPPPAPAGLAATARDESVLLDWTLPPGPVEDFLVEMSDDDGQTWRLVEDGASARTEAAIRPLVNGREYVFRVTAVNLVSASTPAVARAIPFSRPGPPLAVRVEGGMQATVTWRPPANDGGRPITGYSVSGDPEGACRVAATTLSCELTDLPGGAGYTFIVRALNEAGAGEPNSPAAGPVALFSPPSPPVALQASPGDRVVLLTWVPPLKDGNTSITEYLVDYRIAGEEGWTTGPRTPATQTAAAIPGLVNGTTYEFRVRAVNVAGESGPPLALPTETPATVPSEVTDIARVVSNEAVTLTWAPPLADGSAEVSDYAVQYRAPGGSWLELDDETSSELTRTVTGLENGIRFAFRIAAVNRIGQGPWSAPIFGRPVGPPGPVTEPEAVGSLTEIELTWQPPENDGGRPLQGYRVDYRLSTEEDWIRAARVPADVTTLIVGELEGGEAYDFQIVAINAEGFGPANPERSDRPTLAGVIADETPPAPAGLTAIPGDGLVTLTWEASPAGKKSPITAYTVTGSPEGTCVTDELTCVIRGLTNGVRYTFTVTAENANIVGEPSKPVRATPMLFNEATGGTVTTYTKDGRTYRVHRFTEGGVFTVLSGQQPFSLIVVGGGGGSAQAPGGPLYPGGGGGVIDAPRIRLPEGPLAVQVGAGGPAGLPGGESSLESVGTAPAGPAGAATLAEFSSPVRSDVTGRSRVYGRPGSATSGQGRDGRGIGGGGPTVNRGGNGIVIISYEVRPSG